MYCGKFDFICVSPRSLLFGHFPTLKVVGQLYSQFAIVVAICLILSVIESKIILPPQNLRPTLIPKTRPSRNPIAKCGQLFNVAQTMVLQCLSDRNLQAQYTDVRLISRYAVCWFLIAVFLLVMSMHSLARFVLAFSLNSWGTTGSRKPDEKQRCQLMGKQPCVYSP